MARMSSEVEENKSALAQTPKDLTPQKQPQKKALNLRELREKYRKPVRGIFRFHEVPNGVMEFTYREFKEDQPENFKLYDGEIYTIPLGVAKHLCRNGWYPVHHHAVDANMVPIIRVNQKVRRFSFQSLEFTDQEELQEEREPLLTAESI